MSPEEPAPRIGESLVALVGREAGIALEILSGQGAASNLEALRDGRADLAIVEDGAPFDPDVQTLATLHPGVLHVLHRSGPSARLGEILIGKRVYVGPREGIARRLLVVVAHEHRIDVDSFEIVDNPFQDVDVYFTVGGILSDMSLRGLEGYRLFSFGDPAGLGPSSRVAGLTLRYPELRPFVLPEGLYPELDHGVILTLSVPSLLVGRADLPNATAFAIAKSVAENRQRLREVTPLLYPGVSQPIDFDGLSFPLHAGARRYLERAKPSLIERYAEVGALGLSASVALLSLLIAAQRSRARHKKDRLDTYYARALELRDRIWEVDSDEAARSLALQVRSIREEAFGLLIAEKLDANEAFTILVALVSDISNEIWQQLERRPPWSIAPGVQPQELGPVAPKDQLLPSTPLDGECLQWRRTKTGESYKGAPDDKV